jgi:histidinol-phosphate aminotransferase
LISKGMFVRMPAVAPQNRCIRISAGTEQHLDLFEKTFPEALQLAEQ